MRVDQKSAKKRTYFPQRALQKGERRATLMNQQQNTQGLSKRGLYNTDNDSVHKPKIKGHNNKDLGHFDLYLFL